MGIKKPPSMITKLYTNFVMESTDISLALTLCGYGDCDKFITHQKVPCTTFFIKKLYINTLLISLLRSEISAIPW